MPAQPPSKDAKDKDAKDAKDKDAKDAKDAAPPPPPPTTASRLAEILALLRKAAEQRDSTLVLRALRKTTALRRGATAAELRAAFDAHVDPAYAARAATLRVLEEAAAAAPAPAPAPSDPSAMEVVAEDPTPTPAPGTTAPPLPEIDLYLHNLSLRFAWPLTGAKTGPSEAFLESARLATTWPASLNRRTLDALAAKAWQTYALAVERRPSPSQHGAGDALRAELLAAHRRACLSMDEPGQAATINLVLRDMVRRDQISLAAKFAAKASFPDQVSSTQHARYLYYLGRIHAIQLEYGKSLAYLQQAIRKTSSSGRSGLGFRVALHKLCAVVMLLTGEMPDRSWFSDRELGPHLAAYLELAKAVRSGSVATFEACRDARSAEFARDGTLTLVHRLNSSVIKTGLRAINAAYARVSFADVAAKLALDSAEAAEYVCAKAIRDGILDATIDADAGCLVYAEGVDVYSSTSEPLKAFHRRVEFLLDAHNDAVKAMRFPPEAYKSIAKQLNADDDRRDDDEEELDPDKLAELEDGDDDGGMDDE